MKVAWTSPVDDHIAGRTLMYTSPVPEMPRIILCLVLLIFAIAVPAKADVQTIVFVRHGEKPEQGLGQLNCRGLNRALALPTVIANTFGPPNFIFAPNPSVRKEDEGLTFDYVRPLATIEPTAIRFGLPVNASIGWSDVTQLQAELERPEYRNALIVVGWEHKIIETIVQNILSGNGGDRTVVRNWHGSDFDRMFVVTISRTVGKISATFARKHQGLDGRPDACQPK
jgi:hypothetical protein